MKLEYLLIEADQGAGCFRAILLILANPVSQPWCIKDLSPGEH